MQMISGHNNNAVIDEYIRTKGVPDPPGVFLSGSGGGSSCQFAQPWYQVGVVPTSISQLPDRVCGADPRVGR